MVCYSEFTPPKGVTEYQVMIQLTKPGQSYEEQLKLLLYTYSDLKENECSKIFFPSFQLVVTPV